MEAGTEGRWWRIGVRPGRAGTWMIVLSLVIAALAWPISARAGNDKQRVDKLIQRGVELRRAQQDEKALELFRSAYAIEASPRVQGQIALAEQALGQWVEAERDMTSALEGPHDAWVEKNRAALKAALTVVRQHLASVDVVGSPAGARVKVDDHDVGVLPFEKPVRVTAGEVVISVSAPGHTEISRKIKAGPGDLVREVFTLHSVEEAPAPVAKPAIESAPLPPRIASGGSAGVAVAPPPDSSLPHADEGSRTNAVRYWGFAIGASGLAAAGLGTYFALHAVSKNNESKSGCPGTTCTVDASKQARQDALTAGDRATWAFAVGGVLVAAGATLVVLGRHSARQDVALQVTPSGGPGQVGLLGTLGF